MESFYFRYSLSHWKTPCATFTCFVAFYSHPFLILFHDATMLTIRPQILQIAVSKPTEA